MHGMDTLVGILQTAPQHAVPAVEGAALDVLLDIFEESQQQVPVRYGVLKGSGHVIVPQGGPNGFEAGIAYGGAASSYAFFVHERLDLHHNPPTKAKFLEDPWNEKIGELPRRIQAEFEGAVLKQYPQSPAKAATVEMRHDAAVARPGRARKARGMTSEEITKALANIAAGAKGWQRARKH